MPKGWKEGWKAAGVAGALLCGCLFETQEAFRIRPSLVPGSRWMYQYRTFLKQEDGGASDTARHFISYAVEADSILAGRAYSILAEEDLAIFNTDYGIVRNRSLYAIDTAGGRIKVGRLKGGALATGRLPFKTAAETPVQTLPEDTAFFEDGFLALENPLRPGASWIYREMGNPFGRTASEKVLLGAETLVLSGKAFAAWKFRIQETEDVRFNTYEWYSGDTKIFSRASYAANTFNLDSFHIEEEYLGERSFTAEDSAALLEASRTLR
jgi:hypothetical protein